jgi:sporulation protein YlmC with PRC-barrel domain
MDQQTELFKIGSEITCSDGACGTMTRVVLDPVRRAVTHVVVQPKHGHPGRLVPVAVVDSEDSTRLTCDHAEFEAFEDAEVSRFLTAATNEWGYQEGQMMQWPYWGLGMGSVGLSAGVTPGPVALPVVTDRIPMGDVEVRRGDHVQATDGAIGTIKGLVVHPTDYTVTHILLEEGHLWDKKQVTIPIDNVTTVTDAVHLNLTKDEVRDLPPVELTDP